MTPGRSFDVWYYTDLECEGLHIRLAKTPSRAHILMLDSLDARDSPKQTA